MDATYRIETETTIGNKTVRLIVEAPSKGDVLSLYTTINPSSVYFRVDDKDKTLMEDVLTAGVNAS